MSIVRILFFQNGESALHAAALFGQLPVVKLLIEAGADPTLCNEDGMTPLQVAIQAKKSYVVDYLKSSEVKINVGKENINGIVNGMPIVPIGHSVIKTK